MAGAAQGMTQALVQSPEMEGAPRELRASVSAVPRE
ncbi:MAG: MFS transporter, partial [Cyanobacteria bacterium M_surface_7_m2_037]|nr:MFS transporter [Cyanobacteria bacterium M_surface_7_m2_037]